jgi:hypothetical protein
MGQATRFLLAPIAAAALLGTQVRERERDGLSLTVSRGKLTCAIKSQLVELGRILFRTYQSLPRQGPIIANMVPPTSHTVRPPFSACPPSCHRPS